jgi:hypothetical protein
VLLRLSQAQNQTASILQFHHHSGIQFLNESISYLLLDKPADIILFHCSHDLGFPLFGNICVSICAVHLKTQEGISCYPVVLLLLAILTAD